MIRKILYSDLFFNISIIILILTVTGFFTYFVSKNSLDFNVAFLFDQARYLANGAIPHKEVIITHGMLTGLIQGLSLNICGPTTKSIFASTWCFFAIFHIFLFLAFREWMSKTSAFLAALFLLFTIPTFYFPWPNYFVAGIVSIILWLLSKYIKNNSLATVFLAGCLAGTLFFFRQLAALIPIGIFFALLLQVILFKQRKKSVYSSLVFLGGVLFVTSGILLYLFWNDALNDFWIQYIQAAKNFTTAKAAISFNPFVTISNVFQTIFASHIPGQTLFLNYMPEFYTVTIAYKEWGIFFAIFLFLIFHTIVKIQRKGTFSSEEYFYICVSFVALASMLLLFPLRNEFRAALFFAPGFYLVSRYGFPFLFKHAKKSIFYAFYILLMFTVIFVARIYKSCESLENLYQFNSRESVTISNSCATGLNGLTVVSSVATVVKDFCDMKRIYFKLYPRTQIVTFFGWGEGTGFTPFLTLDLPIEKKSTPKFSSSLCTPKFYPKIYQEWTEFINKYKPLIICDSSIYIPENYVVIFKRTVLIDTFIYTGLSGFISGFTNLIVCAPVERANEYKKELINEGLWLNRHPNFILQLEEQETDTFE